MYTRIRLPELLAIRSLLLKKLQRSLTDDDWTNYNQDLSNALTAIKHYLDSSFLEIEVEELEKLKRLAN